MKTGYIFLVFLSSFLHFSLSKILFVFELFRHGTRAPLLGKNNFREEYTDPFGIKWKLNGKLTSMGLRMQYILGTHHRLKYSSLISTIKDPKELLVVSTMTSRTIASAQAHLMGMFPLQSAGLLQNEEVPKANPPIPIDDKLSREIEKLGIQALPGRIQNVPINYFDLKEIFTILTKSEICPKLKSYKENNRKHQRITDFFNKLNNTYGKELMKFFKKNDTSFLYNYFEVFSLADNFVTAYESQKNMSEFASYGIDLEKFNKLCVEMRSLFLLETENTEEISPLAVSITLPKVIQWMEKKLNSDKLSDSQTEINFNEPKIVLYSGHDSTLSPFELFFHKVFNTSIIYPNFGANLVLELHKNETNDEYYVEYLFNGELMIRMNFWDFKRRVLNEIWDDGQIRKFCNNEFFQWSNKTVYILVLGILFVVFIGMFSIYYFKKQVSDKENQNEKEKGKEMMLNSSDEENH